jgi:twitching motility protein PilT
VHRNIYTFQSSPSTQDDLNSYVANTLDYQAKEALDKTGIASAMISDNELGNLRVSVLEIEGSFQIAIRLLPLHPPVLDEIDFNPGWLDWILKRNHSGIFYISGKSSSGITTTLNAILQHVNQHHTCKILSIADQIEIPIVSANHKSPKLP